MFQPAEETEPLIRPNYISTSSTGGGGAEKSKKVNLHNDRTAPDPELVTAASNFVTDIIEKAKAEAARRLKFQIQAQVRNYYKG